MSVRDSLSKAVVYQAIPFLAGSQSRAIKGLSLIKLLTQEPKHQIQIEQLIGLVKSGHPAFGLVQRLFGAETKSIVKHKLIENLGLNVVWQGGQKRRQFAQNHDLEGVFPTLGVISLTWRCNINPPCLGCYAGQYCRAKDALSTEDINWIIDEGKKMGTYFWVFTGGEPFIRKDILELFRQHPDCIFLVYTNGTLINDHVADSIAELGNVAPAISVEGFEAETDARRGVGIYQKAMAAMERLRQRGVVFGFSATAMRTNVDIYLRDDNLFFEDLLQKGCFFGWFFIFVPVGKDDNLELMLLPEQRDSLRRKMLEVRQKYPLFVADFWNNGELTGGCMSAGTLYFHVNADGNLEPCVFLHFAEDNVIEMRKEGRRLYEGFQSQLFRQLRKLNRCCKNPLGPCPIIDHNQHLVEAICFSPKCFATHEGAEAVVTIHSDGLQAMSREYYNLYARQAWLSEVYDWIRKGWPDQVL